MMKRSTTTWIVAASVTAATLIGGGMLAARDGSDAPLVTAEPVTRGDIVSVIAASATVEAVTTVQVGTQISGTLSNLYVDFNAIVRKGQVLARLDASTYQSALESARANLVRAEADRDRVKVALEDAETKLVRARELTEKKLIPRTELETAETNRASAEAQVKSASAQVVQARASVQQAQVNVAKTVIASPIDGVVVARNVDVGQTVAASLSSPTLFVLAADLRAMQLKANIDESDLGRIQDDQPVEFTVDAYPNRTFRGVVKQVRLNPLVEQNVVTYAAIISADNPDLLLKPGMTASVTIETSRRDGVLRVPASALRFKPTDEVRDALGADAAPARTPVLWTYAEGRMTPVPIKVGVGDGSFTEVEGVSEGAMVVTRVAAAGSSSNTSTTRSPLIQTGPAQRR